MSVHMKTGLISGLFLFPLDRTLIISENRKCGEGLPEGLQKNTTFSKRQHFLTTKEKKKKKEKNSVKNSKHKASLRREENSTIQKFLTKPNTRRAQRKHDVTTISQTCIRKVVKLPAAS